MNNRAIFTREFWRGYSVDVRRLRKDPRARRNFVIRNVALLFFAAYIGYYIAILHALHDTATTIVIVVTLLLIAAAIGANRYSQYRESRRQLLEDIASVPGDIAERLQRMAHALTAINERALSELWLTTKTLPEGFTVNSRRVKIEALQQQGAWDELPVEIRAWMMRPDASWPTERSTMVLASAETLHTMLWTLGLLERLRPLDRMIEPLPFDKLAKALLRPARGVRPTWDLRAERNKANEYFFRCYGEKIRRGQINAESAEQKEAFDEWIDDIASSGTDFLAGNETITELNLITLDQATRSSACRLRTLAVILEILDGNDRWSELSDFIYGPFAIIKPAVSARDRPLRCDPKSTI